MASPVMFIRAGNTYFNANQIWQIQLVGDGTAKMYYGGGNNTIHLNMGVDNASAITAMNTLLAPVDVTTNIIA